VNKKIVISLKKVLPKAGIADKVCALSVNVSFLNNKECGWSKAGI